MSKEKLVEKLANIFVEYLKDEEIEYYYFFEDIASLLNEADPNRYNQIFNSK